MSSPNENSAQGHTPDPENPPIPELEVDQTVPPRPEEEIADALRSQPANKDDSQPSE